MNIKIRKALSADYMKLTEILEIVIKDNFRIEGVEETLVDELAAEIDYQKRNLLDFLENPDSGEYFLIAASGQKLVGLIAIGKVNDLIIKYSKTDLSSYLEVKSFYILPEFQKKGIGTQLFNSLMKIIEELNIDYFCLDCGYKNSQSFWIKKIGKPDIVVKNLWGADKDHMIWFINFQEFLKKKQ